MAGAEALQKTSDLGVRTASALVMLAVAGVALWLGDLLWTVFVAALALGLLAEWTRLYLAYTHGLVARLAWALGGALYVGLAALTLVLLRRDGMEGALFPVMIVIATDVGAYFFGRTIGGPKIAPSISPSKTWAGLGGGMLAAALVSAATVYLVGDGAFAREHLLSLVAVGMAAAVFAQVGDFFESWMKRRAGVKDSGHLIPGHGGLFDRLDGLLAVSFLIGCIWLASTFLQAGA